MTSLRSLGLLLLLAGCGTITADDDQRDGRSLYERPWSAGSTYACATCHALAEPGAAPALRHPGHPLDNVLRRPSYKNGKLHRAIDAVNSCLTEWMNATPLEEGQQRWQALSGYFASLETGPGAAVSFEIVQPPATLSGGDAARGRATFNATCAGCHGPDAVGSAVGPALAGLSPSPEVIARRVRTSGRTDSAVYSGLTGGVMVFWARDRLSDDELRDVIAWLGTTNPGGGAGGGSGSAPEVDLSLPGAQSGCGRTSAKIGRRATFSSFAHDVAGVVEIVDDCTLRLRGFHYNGGGIDVRLYGGRAGDYRAGPSLSRDLLGTVFTGQDARVRLPAGVTLDQLDGVAVWCVAVGVSFGDARFP